MDPEGSQGPSLLTTASSRLLSSPPPQVVKIDCVEHRDLCAESVIRAFPTLRLYKAGKAISPDYREDR